MSLAQEAFNNGDYQKAIQLYQTQLQNTQSNQQSNSLPILLNLSSACYSASQYQKCLSNCQIFVKKCQQINLQPKVQSYILSCKSFIKMKKLLSHEEHQFIDQAQKTFPYHKVLQQTIKTVKQLQISQNEDEFMDKMFEKLLCHPEMRNYLNDESFLTKVQKIIRNPSLAGILGKTDKRLQHVTEILLMAEDDEEDSRKKL